MREGIAWLPKLLRGDLGQARWGKYLGRKAGAPVLHRQALERAAQMERGRRNPKKAKAGILRLNGRRVRVARRS